MCEKDKKIDGTEPEEKEVKRVPDYNIEYTEEELADYWGDSCSGE